MRVLFVCMGNICRSPTAEGVFRRLAAERAQELFVEADSAGTHDYHVGDPPDRRAIAAAARRGIDIRHRRARSIEERDFERFDLILAMDRENLSVLQNRAPTEYRARIALMMDYAPDAYTREVPDPYYGSANGFEEVLDLVEQASAGLIDKLLSDVRRSA
jgi:protein-tyrosine phosphatase